MALGTGTQAMPALNFDVGPSASAPSASVPSASVPSPVSGYDTGDFYDETFASGDVPHSQCATVVDRIGKMSTEELLRRQGHAKDLMRQRGITFQVYGDDEGTERIIPFDILPRVVAANEWDQIERGLQQRIRALNLFLADIYGPQQVIRDRVLPEELVETASGFRQPCVGTQPTHGIWTHIVGTDLVRGESGQYHVLEDNLRCPSGVSYVLQNRQLMKQTCCDFFEGVSVRPVDEYCSQLLKALRFLRPDVDMPRVVLMTPGGCNSAYYEHAYLSQQMGVDLVEGRDLVVSDGKVCVRTTHGLKPVDVVYRRVDDDFLDPQVFRRDSLLGVPGIMDVYHRGQVGLANAPGAGIADDKAIYAYVPDFIRYYLQEDAIIPNVPTFCCLDDVQRQHVIENIADLVVKPVDESGGYGLMIGPFASAAEQSEMVDRIRSNPRGYIAQPTLSLSRAPVVTEQGLAGRHVDLRPYCVYGEDIYVLPGGLTRVALEPGALVVNSSQGGGSKDTWVLSDDSMSPPRH